MNIPDDIQAAVAGQLSHLSPEQARSEIVLLKSSPEFWQKRDNPQHPQFKFAHATWVKLHDIGFPDVAS